MKGIIFNIQRFSTEDGPGIRTTVFMKGCPLRCIWCQNPEGINPKPELVWYDVRCIGARACIKACKVGAIKLEVSGIRIDRLKCMTCESCVRACPTGALEIIGVEYSVDMLIDEVVRDTPFYRVSGGGVTFSGGEPMLQADFLAEVLPKLKGLGIHVALDTSGFAPWDKFKKLLSYVDLILYDLKIMDPVKHREFTGVDPGLIWENAVKLAEEGARMWIRTPIIPGMTDNEENVRAIARFIVERLPTVERYELLAFNNLCISKYKRLGLKFPLEHARLMKREEMEKLVQVAKEEGVLNVTWSGMVREVK
ncbi:MAG: glycyl-radical enzyme activating protein [Candidatus Nezhaarchaeota archaeon]|nr:glycyl-radical enzyme activating protein [Candidatus Nezhaarchaeota archaeon]MCX8141608.1 glycyl-radical enzyme activating protein [Candidatus Nezhaarchaeota archaeon]MDW8049875.1 glycyl-radical enzyme activating protein [Nitrososphaerota archaeon]